MSQLASECLCVPLRAAVSAWTLGEYVQYESVGVAPLYATAALGALMYFTSCAIVNAMNAAASTVPAKQLGLLVSYRPLADEASDEDFLGPEAYEATPRRLLHGYLAVSSSSLKFLGNWESWGPGKNARKLSLFCSNRCCCRCILTTSLRYDAGQARQS